MSDTRTRNKLLALAFDLVVFYFLVRWVINNIDPSVLTGHIRELSMTAFMTTMGLNILVILGCGLRMSIILGEKFAKSFFIVNLGYGLNSILPVRIGDFLKIYYGRAIYGVPASKLAPGSFLEKLYDLLAVFLLLCAALVFFNQRFTGISLLVAVLILICVIAIALFQRHSPQAEKLAARFNKLWMFINNARAYISDHRITPPLLLTAALWTAHVLVVYVSFRAFISTIDLGIGDAVTLLIIICLAIAIPAAPAGLGLVEAGIVAYLIQVFGVGKEMALAAALAFHVAVTIPHVIIMVCVLVKYALRRNRLLKKAKHSPLIQ